MLTAISYKNSYFFTSCVDPLERASCNSTCKHALATGYDSLGCCLFSLYAIEESLVRSNAVFARCSEHPRTLCVGGASGETLQVPTTVTVNPGCEELVQNVDESCRYLLMEGIEVSAALFLDELCGATCVDLRSTSSTQTAMKKLESLMLPSLTFFAPSTVER